MFGRFSALSLLGRMFDQVLKKHTGRDENEVFSLVFHPSEQILLSGDVNGCIHFNLFDLDEKTCELPEGMGQSPFQPHKSESCRSIDIIATSNQIVSGGADGRVIISSFDPQVVSKYKFDSAINVITALSESVVLGGDDDGVLLGIDVRMKKKIFSIHEQEDYITGIVPSYPFSSPLKSIVCTAGDCTVAVYDLRTLGASDDKKRKDRLVAMSDPQEDELNCAIVLNQEQNVLTGDADGVVGIWKQGYWGDLKDRIPLYNKGETPTGGMDGSHSIDGMKKIDEKKFLVATSDGIIRVVGLFPNEVERIVGVHRNSDETEIATFSAFDCDVDLGIIATSAGDSEGRIKFWALNAKEEPQSDAEEQVSAKKMKKPKRIDVTRNAEKASKQNFFSDL